MSLSLKIMLGMVLLRCEERRNTRIDNMVADGIFAMSTNPGAPPRVGAGAPSILWQPLHSCVANCLPAAILASSASAGPHRASANALNIGKNLIVGISANSVLAAGHLLPAPICAS